MIGSSPRVRGKHDGDDGDEPPPRLIPACAGKTGFRPRPFGCGWAHPRVCGENVRRAMSAPSHDGSSPRVRGKQHSSHEPHCPTGLIPACAGKTRAPPPSSVRGTAHPRVCGENDDARKAQEREYGSSPRVRGKPGGLADDADRGRLIPACAGKTGGLPRRGREPRAHPRVCGENSRFFDADVICRGSSPRVRGKRWHSRHEATGRRLIPACAGKTEAASVRLYRPAAHPRVCGENLGEKLLPVVTEGSSPRVRGKQHGNEVGEVPVGLIPACAGKTGALEAPAF